MIVLDTNVLSALMQSQPDASVVSWLDRQPSESVWITAINLFEIGYGLVQLTPGKRRKALEVAFTALLRDDLGWARVTFRRIGGRARCAVGR